MRSGLGLSIPEMARRAPRPAAFSFASPDLRSGAVFARSSTGSRFGPTGLIETMAADVPRFDHHPLTGIYRGVLIESAATNVFSFSGQLGNAVWTRDGSLTLIDNAAFAPDGSMSAEKVSPNATAASLKRLTRSGIATGGPVTVSFFGKAAELGTVSVFLTQSGFNGAIWNVATGVVQTVSGGGNTATIENVGGGWYRCIITQTSNGFATTAVAAAGGAYTNITGNGTDGCLLWGVQAEYGVRASSYIPTTTAPVTRSADTLTLNWGSTGVPDGIHIMRYRFDDGSVQDVSTAVVAGLATVPTTLNRAWITSVQRL